MSVALDCLWPVDLISGPPSLPLCCTREATQTQGPILVLNKEEIFQNVKSVIYLPPANEVCEGYVFPGVFLSTGEGGVRGGREHTTRYGQ